MVMVVFAFEVGTPCSPCDRTADTILEELKRTNSKDGIFATSETKNSPPRRSVRRQTIAEVDNEDDDRVPPPSPTMPTFERRNSTGTIYVDRLMGNQDNEGTIKWYVHNHAKTDILVTFLGASG